MRGRKEEWIRVARLERSGTECRDSKYQQIVLYTYPAFTRNYFTALTRKKYTLEKLHVFNPLLVNRPAYDIVR